MTRRLGESSFSFILETDIESGTEHREVSIVVFDVLERWLKGNGFRQLSFPRYFQRIFRTLLEAGVSIESLHQA